MVVPPWMWKQKDSPSLILDLLRKASDNPELIRTTVPERWTPDKGLVVTVVSDGTPVSDRGHTVENVRVRVHGRDGPSVRKMATAIDGYLLTPRIANRPGCLIKAGPGLICIKDSRLGGWQAAITYRVVTSRKVVSNGIFGA